MSFYRQTGFTLIEIMVSLAILAIIAAIAVPAYRGYVEEARFGAAAKDIVQAQLILDDLASDGNLVVLDGGNETVRGLYLRSGQLELADPGATPAKGAPELIRPGESGLLLEGPSDVGGLARLIGELALDRQGRARLGAGGRRAAKEVSLERQLGRLEEIVQEVGR